MSEKSKKELDMKNVTKYETGTMEEKISQKVSNKKSDRKKVIKIRQEESNKNQTGRK